MKNNDQTTKAKASRSFGQEMQQAFTDWVRKLPFLKRNVPEDPDLETSGEVSAEEASAPRPTGGEGGRDPAAVVPPVQPID
jgi:hypothetical protein